MNVFPGEEAEGFEVFFACFSGYFSGEGRGRGLFVPVDGFEVVADELFVEGGLWASGFVAGGGPVAGAVRGENFVAEGDVAVDEAELELGVREEDAPGGGVGGGLGEDGEGEVPELGGGFVADGVGSLLEGDVLVVGSTLFLAAGVKMGSGSLEDSLRPEGSWIPQTV